MAPTYGSGQEADAVDVLHLGPDAQGLAWLVDGHVGVYSQLALCGERGTGPGSVLDEAGFTGMAAQMKSRGKAERRRRGVITVPDMLP